MRLPTPDDYLNPRQLLRYPAEIVMAPIVFRRYCRNDEWETCERRLSHGAGEFMPAQRETLKPPDPS